MLVPVTDAISAPKEDQIQKKFKVQSRAPTGKLQATYGVPLEKFKEFLDLLQSAGMKEEVIEKADHVAEILSRRCGGIDLPEKIHGFIQIFSYYIAEANTYKDVASTVHGRFQLLMKSSFHAVYLQQLNDDERALARVLLLSPDGEREPLMLEAAGLKSEDKVFFNSYYHDDGKQKVEGCTYGEWFTTTITGDERGRDAMSPPRGGYSLEYGMGRFGTDIKNGTVPFEVRSRPGRKRVMMNHHVRTAIKEELKIARRFNPEVLGHENEVVITEHEKQWVKWSHPALKELDEFQMGMQPEYALYAMTYMQFPQLEQFKREFTEQGWNKPYPHIQDLLMSFFSKISAFRLIAQESTRVSGSVESTSETANNLWIQENILPAFGDTYQALDTLQTGLWEIDQTAYRDLADC